MIYLIKVELYISTFVFMSKIQDLIRSEAHTMFVLHQRVHETYEKRQKDSGAWKNACDKFHSYVSALDSYIDEIYNQKVLADDRIIEFSISFLEINPMFFRSGYIKEEVIRKIRRSHLDGDQIERIRNVILNAVKCRGTREYRRYCRLMLAFGSDELAKEIEYLTNSNQGPVRSRAKMMINCLPKKQTHNN